LNRIYVYKNELIFFNENFIAEDSHDEVEIAANKNDEELINKSEFQSSWNCNLVSHFKL